MRGKRKTRAEHVASGNPSRRPLPPDTPASDRAPVMPDHLGEVGIAKWESLCEDMRSRGILSATFADMMGVYCEVYEAYIKALSEATGQPATVPTLNGGVQVNPIMRHIGALRTQLDRCISQLGCSPTQIAKVRGMKTDTKPTGKGAMIRLHKSG